MSAPRIAVVALEAFPWQGRAVEPGDRFEVRPIDAAFLFHGQKARAAEASETVKEAPTPPSDAPPHAPPVTATDALYARGYAKHAAYRKEVGLGAIPEAEYQRRAALGTDPDGGVEGLPGVQGEPGVRSEPPDDSPADAPTETAETPAAGTDAPPAAVPAPRQKRQYRRRDMTPESTTVLTPSS